MTRYEVKDSERPEDQRVYGGSQRRTELKGLFARLEIRETQLLVK
jgi:hypothetical protein